MSDHELTNKKIAELWDAERDEQMRVRPHGLKRLCWDDMPLESKDFYHAVARAACDLGKQAAQDDGFGDCTRDQIIKDDTVERTVKYANGTVVTIVGVADHRDFFDNWRDSEDHLLANDYAGVTYRRKPSTDQHPNPEKHPVILDEDGDVWVAGDGLYFMPGSEIGHGPEEFPDWTPAKIVPEDN